MVTKFDVGQEVGMLVKVSHINVYKDGPLYTIRIGSEKLNCIEESKLFKVVPQGVTSEDEEPGKWIDHSEYGKGYYNPQFECSKCSRNVFVDVLGLEYNFCPRCGKKITLFQPKKT